MKVFISSVISGYEAFRLAVQEAVETLGHEVIRAEDFGASPSSPRIACLAGVRSADTMILLIGKRYGAPQASGKSATHEEFDEARGRKDIIAFVEDVTDREPRQIDFLAEVQDWQRGLFTQSFSNPQNLQRAVTRALHERIIEEAKGAPDSVAIQRRALALLPKEDRSWSRAHPTLAMSLAGGPQQALLRPAQIESDELDGRIFRLALHGANALFDRREGTEREARGNTLVLKQPSRSLSLGADGSIVVQVPVVSESQMRALIEEDVRDLIFRVMRFCGDLLAEIDDTERLRHVCIAAVLLGADYGGWRTRADDRRNPTSMTMNLSGERQPVTTDVRSRATLRAQAAEMAEDLTVLMRRGFSR